jgi:hypothetical protein
VLVLVHNYVFFSKFTATALTIHTLPFVIATGLIAYFLFHIDDICFLASKLTPITYGGFRGLQRLQRLFIIALFGAIIFVGNLFLPPPLNYLMMVVQAVLLALASLFIHRVGAMYVGAVGGF